MKHVLCIECDRTVDNEACVVYGVDCTVDNEACGMCMVWTVL